MSNLCMSHNNHYVFVGKTFIVLCERKHEVKEQFKICLVMAKIRIILMQIINEMSS